MPHRTKLGRRLGGGSKGGKGAELRKGEQEAFSQTEGTADKKARRLEGLWHLGKTKKQRSQSFQTED